MNTPPPVPDQSSTGGTSAPTTREFKTRTSAVLPWVMGGCFTTVGGIAALIGVVGLSAGAGAGLALPLLLGLLFVGLGIGIPVYAHFFAARYTITTRPDGFTVRTDSRRSGTEQKDYRWEEVTSTKYEEYHTRSRGRRRGGSTTTSYFSVETARGQAFRVGREIGDFAGLINMFNTMTPHLPYTWQPQTGFNVNVGIFSAGRNAYTAVPRAAQAPSAPPPAPPAGGPPPLPT